MRRQVKSNVIQGKPIKDGVWDIKPPQSVRSLQLNRYYHGVVVNIFANELGYENEEMHELLKYQFLREEKTIGDKEITITKSTAKLTNKEFIDYCKKIQTLAASYDIYIPDPNEADYDQIANYYKRD